VFATTKSLTRKPVLVFSNEILRNEKREPHDDACNEKYATSLSASGKDKHGISPSITISYFLMYFSDFGHICIGNIG
jgi:hypothetical protein